MKRLIYASTAREGLAEADIRAILQTAREQNRSAHITGFLAFDGSGFLQVLEGPAEAVERIFGGIRRDPRHHDVVVRLNQRAWNRRFADWDMGYVDARTVETGAAFNLRTRDALDWSAWDADEALSFLELLAQHAGIEAARAA